MRILKTDLFRNFMGGFLIGAIALFAMQPNDDRAKIGEQVGALFASIESHNV
ncbi:hypothetical protein [Blastomonas sp.]|uniref:hypothetical protein n=1 Tax=Blastomonas sp. TaxID=1909299 RepID=UPI0035941F98